MMARNELLAKAAYSLRTPPGIRFARVDSLSYYYEYITHYTLCICSIILLLARKFDEVAKWHRVFMHFAPAPAAGAGAGLPAAAAVAGTESSQRAEFALHAFFPSLRAALLAFACPRENPTMHLVQQQQ